MIQFADDTTKKQVWDMWKTVFGDSDDYMEIYFRHKYKNENTLLYVEGGKALSSLQMLSYSFTFCGVEIPILYLSGVCTLPVQRGKGYSRKLILKSFEVASERGVPLILLVPQETWLLNFYDKYGFAKTFDEGTEILPSLKKIIEENAGEMSSAYREFDNIYRKKDMTVQKTYEDFLAMVEEAALFNFPPKRNLTGMARIVDAQKLISLFEQTYPERSFSLNVSDKIMEVNNTTFTLSSEQPVLEVDIRELVQLLMGYHTSEKNASFNILFPEKTSVMNFMLE